MKITSYILVFFPCVLLLSCNSSGNHDSQGKTESTQKLRTESAFENPVNLFPDLTSIDEQEIRQRFDFPDKFRSAIKWTDSKGVHIVFKTETGVYNTDENSDLDYYQNAELHCFHYLITPSGNKKIWEIYDFSKECPFDAKARFAGTFIPVTDVNKNGVPEIWIIYRLACRGDVSPAIQKLIVYEGTTKSKLAGNSRVKVNKTELYGGGIEEISNFEGKPELLTFAKKLWNRNLDESFND